MPAYFSTTHLLRPLPCHGTFSFLPYLPHSPFTFLCSLSYNLSTFLVVCLLGVICIPILFLFLLLFSFTLYLPSFAVHLSLFTSLHSYFFVAVRPSLNPCIYTSMRASAPCISTVHLHRLIPSYTIHLISFCPSDPTPSQPTNPTNCHPSDSIPSCPIAFTPPSIWSLKMSITCEFLCRFSLLFFNLPTAKSEITSFTTAELGNGSIILTCKASQRIPTIYYMIFKRRFVSDVKNGVKIITKVSSNTAGLYKCIAVNIIGNSCKELNITYKELERTALTARTMSSSTGKNGY